VASSDKRADYEDILGRARHGLSTSRWNIPSTFDSPQWPALLDAEGRLPDHVAVDDVANIQYTSGTTGLPKGVHAHPSQHCEQRAVPGAGLPLHRARQASLVPVPLFHCYGCVIGTMSALNTGAAIILPNWTFDPRSTLQAIHNERATSVYGVPTMYVAEFALPDFASFDLTSLRTGMMSGAPCPVETDEARAQRDALPRTGDCLRPDRDLARVTMSDAADSIEIRVNTVGRAMPQTEIQIASVTTGDTDCAHRRAGRGLRARLCAHERLRRRRGRHRAGHPRRWLAAYRRPGHHARRRLHPPHRPLRDVIIRGGENIYPREVEEFLYTHPKVDEAQVVGIPNARLGEIVAAWVRLAPGVEATEEEIKEFCKGQIAYYKIPEHVRFVTEFPATLSGKIQKYKIREFEIEARGLQSVANAATA
jgi:fatty-acyl-CoA synthase